MSGGEYAVLDEFVDHSTEPARAAVRTYVRMELTDGSVAEGEALMIGVLDGDRLDTVHESGRILQPGDDRPEPTCVTQAPGLRGGPLS